MQQSRSASIGRVVGNVPFFFFFSDSGPSNQLHLHSAGVASSHTLPNSHLPVQLMAYLPLPCLGKKTKQELSIFFKYLNCVHGCSGTGAQHWLQTHTHTLSHGVKYYRAIGSSHYALQTGQVSHLPCEKLMAVAT